MEEAKTPYSANLGALSKKWDECSTDEKLDKVRSELRELRYLNNRISQLETTIYQLKNHQHSSDGKTLVPLDNISNLSGLTGAMRMDYLA